MSKISEKVSEIFGFTIREGEWVKYLDELDKSGEPTRKHMAALLFAVCEDIEELRKKMEGNDERTTEKRGTEKSI